MRCFLNKIRTDNRMSIRALAQESGVSVSIIESIEKGDANPTVETLCKLAKVLCVSLGDLISCND